MAELAAVFNDPETHGSGNLLCDNTNGKMYIEGKLIALVGSSALPDNQDHPNPLAATGSSKMYVNGFQVHRNGDLRNCGAATIVSGQSKFFVG